MKNSLIIIRAGVRDILGRLDGHRKTTLSRPPPPGVGGQPSYLASPPPPGPAVVRDWTMRNIFNQSQLGGDIVPAGHAPPVTRITAPRSEQPRSLFIIISPCTFRIIIQYVPDGHVYAKTKIFSLLSGPGFVRFFRNFYMSSDRFNIFALIQFIRKCVYVMRILFSLPYWIAMMYLIYLINPDPFHLYISKLSWFHRLSETLPCAFGLIVEFTALRFEKFALETESLYK